MVKRRRALATRRARRCSSRPEGSVAIARAMRRAERWRSTGRSFSDIVHHCVADTRDSQTHARCRARTGHLGPTVFRSADRGRTWHEAKQPPAFREGSGRVVDHTFWLTPGHASMPGVWYAGTSPQGLFRSDDGGATWRGVDGFNDHPQRKAWCGGDQDGTPDGPKLHSMLIDPREPQAYVHRHVERRRLRDRPTAAPAGARSTAACARTFCPISTPNTDTIRIASASIRACPIACYQQNHCGIYRLDRPAERWQDIGASMPKSVGSIGFPMVLHPRDPDTLVGVSDGWLQSLAARLTGRQAGRLSFGERRPDLAAASDRVAESDRRG